MVFLVFIANLNLVGTHLNNDSSAYYITAGMIKKCILIYDDDEDILEVTKLILEDKYKVQSRSRCDDIISDVKKVMPHLILMDILIPVMGGAEAIRLLNADESINKIPVILFSAANDIESVYKSVRADGFLKKPFNIMQLEQVIKTMVS